MILGRYLLVKQNLLHYSNFFSRQTFTIFCRGVGVYLDLYIYTIVRKPDDNIFHRLLLKGESLSEIVTVIKSNIFEVRICMFEKQFRSLITYTVLQYGTGLKLKQQYS